MNAVTRFLHYWVYVLCIPGVTLAIMLCLKTMGDTHADRGTQLMDVNLFCTKCVI